MNIFGWLFRRSHIPPAHYRREAAVRAKIEQDLDGRPGWLRPVTLVSKRGFHNADTVLGDDPYETLDMEALSNN